MAAIWQITSSNTWWQCLNFAQKNPLIGIALVQLTIPQHWFGLWLGILRQQARTYANDDPVRWNYICIVWLGHNGLTPGRQDMGSYSSNFAKFGFITFSQVDKSRSNNFSSGYSYSSCHLLWCSSVVGDGINSLRFEIVKYELVVVLKFINKKYQ